ncbi:MAG TPA: hemerythrin domain-containing protein [Candidatus Thioglobus autotrophicus]|jgi:Hemerythrin HHE cation binding domain.|uniref:hemerythrin domain-containing protein n=1 Tax=Candidatus Thioglobus sp. TaxID=2026721 RepID=UPI0017A39029|nr:hemerythrin domain-containing protein [Candidatus Thioglobus sp.]HIL03981.1 hemerythrin domain-containing protein [Candidatus Thioglobus autotrophicus]
MIHPITNELCFNISQIFKASFQAHFHTEEVTIFAALKDKSPELNTLCAQLVDEHQQLHQMAKDLKNRPELLAEFGVLLKTHSRAEDRQLFPYINLLSEVERQAIQESSVKHAAISKAVFYKK